MPGRGTLPITVGNWHRLFLNPGYFHRGKESGDRQGVRTFVTLKKTLNEESGVYFWGELKDNVFEALYKISRKLGASGILGCPLISSLSVFKCGRDGVRTR